MVAGLAAGILEDARDRQDAGTLNSMIERYGQIAAKSPSDARAQYDLALARSYAAEVAMEKGDKRGSASAAESGIDAARKAVAAQGSNAEYHRLLGTLCGQVIPANVLAGLKYGRCAMDEVSKAIELNPKSSENFLARAVGNYYLPPSFGGGLDKALEDADKAIALDAKNSEAWLWKGIIQRKMGKNADARKAIAKALELNPKRVWTKTQLEKTPEK